MLLTRPDQSNGSRTFISKASRGVRRLRVPMPYVALAEGVSGYKWARAWLDMRKSFSCAFDPSLGGVGVAGCFLHSPVSTVHPWD
eukprot:4278406-Amphidinium_carterae.4